MLPEEEKDALVSLIDDAGRLAREGKLAAGYDALRLGLRFARLARRHGYSWGGDLVERYRGAGDDYIERYGVKIENSEV